MSIDGRITVDALFHDTSGSRLKVLSLESSKGYTGGKAVRITGTSSGAVNWASYRDASGSLVSISDPVVVAFAFSGVEEAVLSDIGDETIKLQSKDNLVAVSCVPAGVAEVLYVDAVVEGTWTVIVWGAS